jgi:asparagine synthase (glutamine-hydrolysing)
MQFVGVVDSDKDIPLKLSEKGFQRIIQDEGFALFIRNGNPQKDFSLSEYHDIHLLIIGHITNGEEIIKRDDISYKETKTVLCESLIRNYLDSGEQAFSQLDGSYVIILWDGNKKGLYVQRDCYGTKCLYYYITKDKGVIFSNSLDILIRTKKQKDIARKALHEYLRFLDISPPYTIYENVFSLEPEKTLIVHDGEVFLKDIAEQSINEQKSITLSEAVEDFKRLMLQSIERRIQHSQRTGVFLSGGIDSALICALASKINSNLKVYTVGFDNPRYDESNIAHDITTFLGLEHHIFKFSIKEDLQAFTDFVSTIPSPFADPAAIPTFQCFQKMYNSIDVVLDGTGADSLIGIMPARHIRFILRYLRYIPYRLRHFISSLLKQTTILSSYCDLFNFTEPEELLIRWRGWTKEEISVLCNQRCDLSHTRFYKVFAENSSKHPYELYGILLSAMPDDRIIQLSTQFRLHIAFPFWDKNVRQFGENLPIKYKHNDGTSKLLYKKILQEFIPQSIWDRPKHGFDYPFENLLKYNDYELPKSFLSKDAIDEHGLFDFSIVEKYVQSFLNSDDSLKFKIWALVLFQAWYHKHYKIIQ